MSPAPRITALHQNMWQDLPNFQLAIVSMLAPVSAWLRFRNQAADSRIPVTISLISFYQMAARAI